MELINSSDNIEDVFELDNLNISKNIKHYPVCGRKHFIFQFLRKLGKTVNSKSLLCVQFQKTTVGTKFAKDTFHKFFFKNTTNTSNLLQHMRNKHGDVQDIIILFNKAKNKTSSTVSKVTSYSPSSDKY